MIFQQLTT